MDGQNCEQQLQDAEQNAQWWRSAAEDPHATDVSAQVADFYEEEVSRLREQRDQAQESASPSETRRFSDGWGRGEWVESSDRPGIYALDSSPEAIARDRALISARAEQRRARWDDPDYALLEQEYQADAGHAQSRADVAAQEARVR
ncbi:hypothetical protein K1T35_48280 (plasmid) [Pseudonocardia sp. DSM 110487]|uniref:hypothetical protein n=1 Tax=Pseudonocardia sp. DSM 110487 TaxID=2865833 RepID=UPI001C6974DE|nr:hypothetical protein [Pseudonocardia sp. DSM 110487]QYN41147.1 hypothetical protein K1T35_48280 [Pseudonocardia sp. DSM 110487]